MNEETIKLLEKDAHYKRLIELSAYNREAFRLDASNAFKEYSLQDRIAVRKLESTNVSVWKLLDDWKNELLPALSELEKNRTKASFNKTLTRQLLLDKEAATELINDITKKRHTRFYDDFTMQHYPAASHNQKDELAKQRRFARVFLQRTYDDIENFRLRYNNYMLYKAVADARSIVVIDSRATWVERQRNIRSIRKERKQTSVSESQRLREISKRLTFLLAQYDDLVGKVLDNRWDIATVITLRNQYEKKLQSSDIDLNPLERLAVFESVTGDFRREHVSKQGLKQSSKTSLTDIRRILNETEAVLLQFFDLSNSQKNQLLIYANEARQLSKEQATIKAAQHRRYKSLHGDAKKHVPSSSTPQVA